MNSGLRATRMQALVQDPFDPKTFFAIVPTLGMLRSADGGVKWEPRNNGLADLSFLEHLSIDPVNRGTLYAMGVAGLFKTLDAGDTWVRLAPFFGIKGFAIDLSNPSIVIP